MGAGLNLNFYPFNINVEAGKGIKLNKKGYLSLNTAYRVNDNWKVFIAGNINGPSTPIKAANQNVYTKDIESGFIYIFRDLFQIGSGLNFMKFDDGNLRKSFYVWGSA